MEQGAVAVKDSRETFRRESFFVPYLGKSVNEMTRGKASWLYYAEKKKVEKAAMVAGMHHVALFERPVVIALFPQLGPKRRKFDCSNYGVTLKLIEDQLVRCNVLRDDSSEYVKGIYIGAAVRAPDGVEGMQVVIEETHGDLPAQQIPLDLVASVELPF